MKVRNMKENLLFFLNFIVYLNFVQCGTNIPALTTVLPKLPDIYNQSRRILGGTEVGDTRPYMVYLKLAKNPDVQQDPNWLCGGTIIHEQYVLTSAACIEDAKHFYVISGTHKWADPDDDDQECIKNGAKKAVWKCVPKSYVYDGDEYDNIRWMIADIAVVKVDEPFNFKRRVRGCDFIPEKVAYNNRSQDLEKSNSIGSTAGWGSTGIFSDSIKNQTLRNTSIINSPTLLEADVVLISKKNCKKRWPERYHYIIDMSMICGKDTSSSMDSLCAEQHVDCKQLVYSEESDEDDAEKKYRKQADIEHIADQRRSSNDNEDKEKLARKLMKHAQVVAGGFCENDHGGPLIVGQGKTAMVIGVICACQTMDVSRKCQGPFLYTSVYKYRHLISCALYKETDMTCRRWLQSTKTSLAETTFDWTSHIEGLAKDKKNATRHAGVPVLRAEDDDLRTSNID